MKDEQGTNIINPETMKIIRNLREKAKYEGKDREFYINSFRTDYALTLQTEILTAMAALERYGQEWCIKNGIIGFDYITSVNVKTQ